jgi:hypothetical protein
MLQSETFIDTLNTDDITHLTNLARHHKTYYDHSLDRCAL